MTFKAGPVNPHPQSEVTEAKIYSSKYRHNLLDTKVHPLSSIISNISGYRVTVDYYSQVLARDQDVDGFNASLKGPYQQYRRIKNLVIKTDSPFNYSMSLDVGVTQITGDAKLFISNIIPIEGDFFLANIGNGRLGRFEVSSPRPLSQYDNKVHQFEFKLMGLATINEVELIDKRVVESLTFVEDFLVGGQNPLLTDEKFSQLQKLTKGISKLTKVFLTEFHSENYGTLLVPSQSVPTYDPYVTDCILNLVGYNDHPLIKRIRNLNVDDLSGRDYIDIYSVLLERDVDMLSICFRSAGKRPSSHWSRNKNHGTIAFSGISDVVYPRDRIKGVDATYDSDATGFQGSDLTNNAPYTQLIEDTAVLDNIGTNDTYVFSNALYDKTRDNESILTKLSNDYLTEQALDIPKILQLISQVHLWSDVDRFYHIPVLMIVAKAALGEL